MYYYRGYFIARDLAGDGWNILRIGKIIDEGYASIRNAVIAIDEIEKIELYNE